MVRLAIVVGDLDRHHVIIDGGAQGAGVTDPEVLEQGRLGGGHGQAQPAGGAIDLLALDGAVEAGALVHVGFLSR